MRPRSIAVSTATLIAAASLTPAMASAAGTNTLYVSNTNTNCTDSGTGTLAAPFCTVQPALDAANPGDLVNIAQGNYAAATITHSGTASAPIVITGNAVAPTGLGTLIAGGAGISGLNLSGASDIQIENLRILPNPAGDSVVDGGSDVTFTRDLFTSNTTAGADALHVTGSAADVTVRDSMVASTIVVDGGAIGTILTTNILSNFTAANPGGVSVAGATDTAVTSNSIAACGTGVSVTGSASGTRVENNVIDPLASGNCPNPAQSYALLVDASSASGTMADYNNVYDNETGSSDYDWDTTPYSTAAALYAATGQGQHDNNSLIGTESVEGSPEINSADSAAVGEQQVDYRGSPRTLDPLVTPTGAGPDADYDRGALQFEDPMTAVNRSFTASASKVPAGVPFTLNAAMTDTWSDSFTYHFAINGVAVSTGTNGTYTTSISTPGTYSVSVAAVPTTPTATPSQLLSSLTIQVAPTAPLAAKETLAANGTPRGVTASDLGTTDDWNITKVTFDFGDGTPLVSTTDGAQVQHAYATGGTYNVTETVTDASGATQSTTSPFSTTAPPAGTLTDTDIAPDGIGAYLGLTYPGPGGTGIKQAAVTGFKNGTAQAVAVTDSGTLEFATRTETSFDYFGISGTWSAWTTLSQPGVTVTDASIAGMPDGSSQIIEVTSTGVLKHIIRNANGTWQASGWGTPVGSTGIKQAAITAMPNGNSQLVAVTTSGVLLHNIRFAKPASWQGWDKMNQPGVIVTDASIAGAPDGSSQLVEVASTGVLKHNIRLANNTWQAGGWGIPVGSTGIKQASITVQPNGTSDTVAVTTSGTIEIDRRNMTPSWSLWYGTGIEQMLGSEASASVGAMSDDSSQLLIVNGG